MKKIAVSIIVPVYNAELYVERCLNSVIRQTYDGWMECIVVDDCGTDNSIETVCKIVSEYAGPISFRIIHHTHNRGLSAARNTGINEASGDYVFFLDSDDELLPSSIEILASPIQKDRTIEMVMGERKYASRPVNTPLIPFEVNLSPLESVRRFYLTHRLSVAAWNKLVDKRFLKTNQLSFKEGLLHEDLLWTHYVMKCLGHLYLLPETTYLVHSHPNSITRGLISKEVLACHKGKIYEEIAMNLTSGEEALEVAHYFSEFCWLFCHYPHISSIQRAASLFRRYLSDGNHPKEHLVLSSILALSKSAMGRWFMSIALRLLGLLKRTKSTKR